MPPASTSYIYIYIHSFSDTEKGRAEAFFGIRWLAAKESVRNDKLEGVDVIGDDVSVVDNRRDGRFVGGMVFSHTPCA